MSDGIMQPLRNFQLSRTDMTPKNMHDVTSPLPVNNDRNKVATKVCVSGNELLEIHKKWFNIKIPWHEI